MLKYRSINLIILIVTSISIIFAFLVNYAVDPFGLFGTPTIKMVNLCKPEKKNHERMFKAAEIVSQKPNAIFLGTSRVRVGLNPDHYLSFFPGHKAYNLGISSGSMYDLLRYFQHTLYNNSDLRHVIIGIDIYSFSELTPATDFEEYRLCTSSLH